MFGFDFTDATSMREARCFFRCHRRFDWMTREVLDRLSHVPQQDRTEVPAHTVTYKDPLNDQFLTIRRQGIRRNLPSAGAQTIGKIIKAETGIGAFLDPPTDAVPS